MAGCNGGVGWNIDGVQKFVVIAFIYSSVLAPFPYISYMS